MNESTEHDRPSVEQSDNNCPNPIAEEIEETVAEEASEVAEPLSDASSDTGTEEEALPDGSTTDPDDSSEVPADPPTPYEESDSEEASSQNAALNQEIARLKEELAQKNLHLARTDAMLGEFRELYPDVTFEEIPDDVMESVRSGIPLSAAYALSERRRMLREARAKELNQRNTERSSGALGIAETVLFTPAEVRAMSREEVRKNYDKILKSMQSWT